MRKYFWEILGSFTNKTALAEVDSDKTITYSELDKLTDELAEQFISEEKKLIFLFTNNSIESVIAYLSALKSGDAVLLLDAKLNSEMRNNLVSIYKPSIIINHNEPIEGYEKKSFATLENCLYNVNRAAIKIHPSLKVLLSTSGTTGSPKLVRLSADNIQSNAEAITQYL